MQKVHWSYIYPAKVNRLGFKFNKKKYFLPTPVSLILLIFLLLCFLHLLSSFRSLSLGSTEGGLIGGSWIINLCDFWATWELVLDRRGRWRAVVGSWVFLAPADVDILKLPVCINRVIYSTGPTTMVTVMICLVGFLESKWFAIMILLLLWLLWLHLLQHAIFVSLSRIGVSMTS